MSQQYIFEYVLNKRKQRVGVVVAEKCVDGKVYMGFSLTNTSAGDKFNRVRGLDIARTRACQGSSAEVPHSVRDTYERIYNRAIRYFKVQPYSALSFRDIV